MKGRRSPALLMGAFLAGLAGGLIGSFLFSSTPAQAQRDWSLPEQPSFVAVVPPQGYTFQSQDGRVVAKLEGDRGGTVLTLIGADGAQVRIGAGTRNATVHLEADPRNVALLTADPEHAELMLRGGGRDAIDLDARQHGGSVQVNGQSVSTAPAAATAKPSHILTQPQPSRPNLLRR